MSQCAGRIRQMQYADLSRVTDIWLQTCICEYAFVCEHTGQTPEQFWGSRLAATIHAALAADVYVFETEGQIAGFITFRPAKGGTRDLPAKGGIRDLFVDRPFQNKGIGSDLIAVAKSFQCHLGLAVYQKKVAAIRFYERHGFHITRVLPPDEETRQIILAMEWKPEPCEPRCAR